MLLLSSGKQTDSISFISQGAVGDNPAHSHREYHFLAQCDSLSPL